VVGQCRVAASACCLLHGPQRHDARIGLPNIVCMPCIYWRSSTSMLRTRTVLSNPMHIPLPVHAQMHMAFVISPPPFGCRDCVGPCLCALALVVLSQANAARTSRGISFAVSAYAHRLMGPLGCWVESVVVASARTCMPMLLVIKRPVPPHQHAKSSAAARLEGARMTAAPSVCSSLLLCPRQSLCRSSGVVACGLVRVHHACQVCATCAADAGVQAAAAAAAAAGVCAA